MGENTQSKLLKVEYPMGRKYGECCIAELMSVQMLGGAFVQTLHIKDKPKPLSKADAIIYYTKKLKEVWEMEGYYVKR